jgi:low temperature requirement protein LtrA
MSRWGAGMISRSVSPLELFFDLVFVFAVLQLSHHLLGHLSWLGAAETAVLWVAVYCVWAYTRFEATQVHAGSARQRLIVVAVMLLGLFMNAAIGWAFTEHPWAFVVPLLVSQLGRGVVTSLCAPSAGLRAHYRRMTLWLVLGAVCWVAGSTTGEQTRLLWWGLAAVLDLAGTWLASPSSRHCLQSEGIPFDSPHVVERCQLFLLIVLGETLLDTGSALSEAPLEPATLVTGAAACVSMVALWALYGTGFDRLADDRGASTRDPVRAARVAVSGLVVVVAALITLAVGHETVIRHLHEPTSTPMVLLLVGGPALYILTQAGTLRAYGRTAWRPRLVAVVLLVLAGALSRASLPPVGASLLVALILCGLVAVLKRQATGWSTGPS